MSRSDIQVQSAISHLCKSKSASSSTWTHITLLLRPLTACNDLQCRLVGSLLPSPSQHTPRSPWTLKPTSFCYERRYAKVVATAGLQSSQLAIPAFLLRGSSRTATLRARISIGATNLLLCQHLLLHSSTSTTVSPLPPLRHIYHHYADSQFQLPPLPCHLLPPLY